MKKPIKLAIVAFAAGAATIAYGQGYITLDNYSSGSNPPITYGPNVPADGISGAIGGIGAPLSSAWTIGLYYVGGTTGLSQAAGWDMPDPSLSLGTGVGSTVAIGAQNAYGNPGYYGSFAAFYTGSTLNTTVTLELVLYPTAAGSYENALYRARSAAFSMPTVAANSPSPICTGDFMPGSGLYAIIIPEPATLALVGLAGLTLWWFLRQKVGRPVGIICDSRKANHQPNHL